MLKLPTDFSDSTKQERYLKVQKVTHGILRECGALPKNECNLWRQSYNYANGELTAADERLVRTAQPANIEFCVTRTTGSELHVCLQGDTHKPRSWLGKSIDVLRRSKPLPTVESSDLTFLSHKSNLILDRLTSDQLEVALEQAFAACRWHILQEFESGRFTGTPYEHLAVLRSRYDRWMRRPATRAEGYGVSEIRSQ